MKASANRKRWYGPGHLIWVSYIILSHVALLLLLNQIYPFTTMIAEQTQLPKFLVDSVFIVVLAVLALWFVSRINRSHRVAKLTAALDGSVSRDTIAEFASQVGGVHTDVHDLNVTLLFVDMAGFNAEVERRSPRQAFELLREHRRGIAETIFGFNGLIISQGGDGILAMFGCGLGGESRKGHAESALACAVRMQQEALLDLAGRRVGRTAPILMRVGVHTARVYVGDIASYNSFELSVIGEGVGFVRRLQQKCEPFRVLMSAATRDSLVANQALKVNLASRQMFDQGISDDIVVYEYDPVIDQPDLRRRIQQIFKDVSQRRVERFIVPELCDIPVHTLLGDGLVRDFSASGLAIELGNYLASGVHMNVWLGQEGSQLRERCQALGPLLCEVKWGTPRGSKFLHGLEIKFATQEMGHEVVRVLRESFALDTSVSIAKSA